MTEHCEILGRKWHSIVRESRGSAGRAEGLWGCAVQQWGDDGGDSGSSDGRGSSYFSGERVERDKSNSASPLASHSCTDHPGAAAQQVLLVTAHAPHADTPRQSGLFACPSVQMLMAAEGTFDSCSPDQKLMMLGRPALHFCLPPL